jgi:hypothetical protein
MGKTSKRCWFSKLTLPQLEALAAAAAVPPARDLSLHQAKAVLVARLYASPLAAVYGMTYLSPISGVGGCFELVTDRDGGVSMDTLKAWCRERGVPVTGNRYKLVLALLHHDGAGARGTAAAAAVKTAQGKKTALEMRKLA